MKLIMENWRQYQKEELLKEEIDYYFSLFEESNEELLKEMLLDEGAVLDFFKTALSLPKAGFDKLVNKASEVLSSQLKKRGVKKHKRRDIQATVLSEPNKKLAFAFVMALIGLLIGGLFGPDALTMIQGWENATVTQMYQAVDSLGDMKDMVVAASAIPIFASGELINKAMASAPLPRALRRKFKGLGKQTAGKFPPLPQEPSNP